MTCRFLGATLSASLLGLACHAARPGTAAPASLVRILMAQADAAGHSVGLSPLRSTALPTGTEEVRVWIFGGWGPVRAMVLTRDHGRVTVRVHQNGCPATPYLTPLLDPDRRWRLVDASTLPRLAREASVATEPVRDSVGIDGTVTVSCSDCEEYLVEWRSGAEYHLWYDRPWARAWGAEPCGVGQLVEALFEEAI